MEKIYFENFFHKETNEINYLSKNINDTLNFAYEFAKYLNKSNIIVLNGELGSGKTVFVKGIARYFNIEKEVVSPTFTIVNEYITKDINIYHFDVYRIHDEIQFTNTVGTDYFENGISIIEWGDIIKSILPKNTIYIDIQKIDENTREIKIRRNI